MKQNKLNEFIGLRLPSRMLSQIDQHVESGFFHSRSHALRSFITDGVETARSLTKVSDERFMATWEAADGKFDQYLALTPGGVKGAVEAHGGVDGLLLFLKRRGKSRSSIWRYKKTIELCLVRLEKLGSYQTKSA